MNDAQARELLPSLVAGLLEAGPRGELLAYLATRPQLEQEYARMQSLFQRVGHASETPPPSVWSAIEAAIERDIADTQSPRVLAPVPAPRWRGGSGRANRPQVTDSASLARADLLFGKIALNWALLSRDLLSRALNYQRQAAPHLRLGEILLEKGILDQAQVDEILAYQARIESVRGAASFPEANAASFEPMDGPAPTGHFPSGSAPPYDPMGEPAFAGPTASSFGSFASYGPSSASQSPYRAPVDPPTEEVPAGEPLIGTVIDGCRIVSKIGAGGMGEIYLAEHEALRVKVVVKILSPESASNPRTVERFQREARAAARLEHANVVGVRDVGTTETGLHYIVMQYIEGQSLEEKLQAEGRQELRAALTIALKIASGLQAAHAAGVIHRDVKADNVLVSTSGEVRVADFGLAKDLNSELKLTADGAMIGTPLYMAPEIGRVREIDGRVDVFSLGVTLYYLLTGVQPFRGFTALDILSAKAHDKIKPPEEHWPDIPADVRAVLGRMLAKDRDQRYGDMGEVIADLERLQRGIPVEVKPGVGPWPSMAKRAAKDTRGEQGEGRRRALLLGLVGVVLLLALLTAALVWLI